MLTGGRAKHNFLSGGAFRFAKYEKLRRRKKKRHNPLAKFLKVRLWCLYCTKLEPIFKTNDSEKAPRTGEYASNPERKNTSCISGLAGVKFFLKMERTFFFGVLPKKFLGSPWGFNTDSAKRKSVFLGILIFRFASADFPPAGGVWGGMRVGFGLGVFGKFSALLLIV